jgi:hypothetical protein
MSRRAHSPAEHRQAVDQAARWAQLQHQPNEPVQLALALEEQRKRRRKTRGRTGTNAPGREVPVTPAGDDPNIDWSGGDAA